MKRFVLTYIDNNSFVHYGVEAQDKEEACRKIYAYMVRNAHFIADRHSMLDINTPDKQAHFEVWTSLNQVIESPTEDILRGE